MQYGLVGLSIALFFLLLLALSEKMAFGLAYAMRRGCQRAAAGGVLQRGAARLAARPRPWRPTSALLYGALYGLLASESNALLLGALLVFGMLAVLMLATRRVDWYALSAASAAGQPT